MMKKINRWFFLQGALLILAIGTSGCFLFKSEESSNRLASKGISTSGPSGALSLAENMLNDIAATLINQMGYTRPQAHALVEGALSIMDGEDPVSGTRLTAQLDLNNLLQVAPAISEGMIKAMGNKLAGLDNDDKKMTAVGDITSALFKTLVTKVDALPVEQKVSLPASIANKAISSLNEGGVTATKIGGSAGSIMKESVGSLSTMGLSSQNMMSAVGQVTRAGINGISNNKASAATVQDAAKNIVQGAVSALSTIKETSTNETPSVSDMVGPIVSNAVSALKTVTFTAGSAGAQVAVNTSSQMKSIVGDMMSGAVSGLNAAGVTSTAEMSTALTSATSSAVNGLRDAGLSTQAVTYALNDIVKGTVGSLGGTSTNSADAIKAISSTVISAAMTTTLDIIKAASDGSTGSADANKSLMKNAALMASQGAVTGLGELTQQSTIKATDLQSATASVTKSTVSDLIVAAQSISTTTGGMAAADVAALVTSVADGITEGLYKSGLDTTAVKNATTDIGSGAVKGAQDAAAQGASVALTQADLTNISQTAQDSVTSAINEMKTRCEQAAGTWNGTTCQYPTAAPVAAAASDTQKAQEQDCLSRSGQALYTSAGTFVCVIPDTTPPKDPAAVAFANPYCTGTSVTMSWSTDTSDASLMTHNVKLCSTQGCSGVCSAVTTADGTSAVMTGAANSVNYGCVQAVDKGGNRSNWVASDKAVTFDTAFRFPDQSVSCDDSNMMVSWQPVFGATNYDVAVYDRTCTTQLGQTYTGVTGTSVGVAEDLNPSTLYCVKVAAKDDSGDVLASSNIVDSFGDSFNAAVASHAMLFERMVYQTRSTKRVLVDTSLLPQGITSTSVGILGNAFACAVTRNYTALDVAAGSSFDALTISDQKTLASLLTYGSTPGSVAITLSATGASTNTEKATVVLHDFAIRSLTTTSFGSNVQMKAAANGYNYQGWVSPLTGGIATAGNNILVAGFEWIVNY